MVKLLDYLVAAIERAVSRGFEAEASALANLYQAAASAILLPREGDSQRVKEALEGLEKTNPRRARAIKPHFEYLYRR